MTETDAEKRTWSLQNKILAAAASALVIAVTVIGILALEGFKTMGSTLKEQMVAGDVAIHQKIKEGNEALNRKLDQIAEASEKKMEQIRAEVCSANSEINKVKQDVTRIDTNQKARLDDERIRKELELKKKMGLP